MEELGALDSSEKTIAIILGDIFGGNRLRNRKGEIKAKRFYLNT